MQGGKGDVSKKKKRHKKKEDQPMRLVRSDEFLAVTPYSDQVVILRSNASNVGISEIALTYI